MEFLGDRVLGLTVAKLLFNHFEKEEEGDLSRRHAALVRSEALTKVALNIGLNQHMAMSKSEELAGGRDNPNILADACEALIAALYLDGGIEIAEDFIFCHWTPLMNEDTKPPKDAKTTLQEWAQGRSLPLPTYMQIKREGKDHAPTFYLEVSVEGFGAASGAGANKRAAEQEAASAMLEQILRKA